MHQGLTRRIAPSHVRVAALGWTRFPHGTLQHWTFRTVRAILTALRSHGTGRVSERAGSGGPARFPWPGAAPARSRPPAGPYGAGRLRLPRPSAPGTDGQVEHPCLAGTR